MMARSGLPVAGPEYERVEREADFFWSDFTGWGPRIVKGHETITERAVRAVGLASHMSSLIRGVQRPDRASSGPPREQKRHALRREPCQSASALKEIRGHLLVLHGLAISSRGSRDTWLALGESLHLIQDSYSPAHTERSHAGNNPIIYIRSYRHGILVGPSEHLYPVDQRDYIRFPTVRPWAARAEAVSVEYLKMARGHLVGRLTTPAARPDVVKFMNRHLVLSAAHKNPWDRHRACRGAAPKRTCGWNEQVLTELAPAASNDGDGHPATWRTCRDVYGHQCDPRDW
jgi:hypothetical protein